MDQLTRDLSGVAVYLDDLLVSGANAEEHPNLQALLPALTRQGLRSTWRNVVCPVLGKVSGSHTIT